MRAKRIKINLNPDKEEDRRILDYLQYAGVSYTKAIKTAVMFYLDREEGGGENRRFLQEVKETIRESVQGLRLTPSVGESAVSTEISTTDDTVSSLSFLEDMMSGDTFGEGGPTFFNE